RSSWRNATSQYKTLSLDKSRPFQDNPIMTILQAHQTALARLVSLNSDSAETRATARILLDALTSTPHAHLTRADGVFLPAQQEQFFAALDELEAGRPLPYVLGKCDFFGLDFQCDERALIPRPETELLVELALE